MVNVRLNEGSKRYFVDSAIIQEINPVYTIRFKVLGPLVVKPRVMQEV